LRPTIPFEPIDAALERITGSHHLCSICASESERLEIAVAFIRIGLARGEKCFYVADRDSGLWLREALQKAGVDAKRALEAGALVLATPAAANLRGDSFDPYRLFNFWKRAAASASHEGFSALRGGYNGSPFDAADPAVSARWREYESKLTDMVAEVRCSFACQYVHPSVPAPVLLPIIRSHPTVIYRGAVCRNIYHRSADEWQEDEPFVSEVNNLLADLYERTSVSYGRGVSADYAFPEAQAALARFSRLTTLGELTASIAHEIIQPLTAVISNAHAGMHWLTERMNIEEARAAFAGITRDAMRARVVIERIRALVREGSGETSQLLLNEVIQEALSLLDGQLHGAAIKLRTELAPDLPRISADRVQLQQLMLNLVMNAIDAMRSMSGTARELIIRTCEIDGATLQASVEDSGVGLDPANVELMFESFFTTKPYGMGIGLSISRKIVEAHGGRLWATQNQDRPGATFFFTLPYGP
jgi:signal transduction histidine kinase